MSLIPEVAAESVGRSGKALANKRPDMVLFDRDDKQAAAFGRFETQKDGVRFCREATFILDAKKFQKPIGADSESLTPKASAESTAMADIDQVERYLRGFDHPWGILTNGRDWRLIRRGDRQKHFTFHLVELMEHILVDLAGVPDEESLTAFRVFYQIFGPQSRAVLHNLTQETESEERQVREVLQENAHFAVEALARGFWARKENSVVFGKTDQATLDQLRELSLVFLYRLLFLFKAEAQGLLPLIDENGATTRYADVLSTAMIFKGILGEGDTNRPYRTDGFERLASLFATVNGGNEDLKIPAYNGGLFDPGKNAVLDEMVLDDASVYRVFVRLMFLNEEATKGVPYADLDVRDLGDIYEGLLEQRLVVKELGGHPVLELVNQKGERKASGSYFTPDRLVEHLVRRTVEPLLQAVSDQENDAQVRRILSLKIVDPSMGSGHFLVKVIDVVALWLTLNCDPLEPESPRDNGPKELAYWKAKVAENCVYGVDYNPMSVELAKVAVWLHTARRDKPLTFLDHHFKVGNSLVGADLAHLGRAALTLKTGKKASSWVARPWARPKELGFPRTDIQPELPFDIDEGLLAQVLTSIRSILDRPADQADEVKRKEKDYAEAVGVRLEAFRLLADLWCAQWFLAEPTPENAREWTAPGGLYETVKGLCALPGDGARSAALSGLASHPLVQAVRGLPSLGFGPRPFAFFHWELEFPEVFFGLDGHRRPEAGFDAVVGNPPWDKIKPATKDFYGPWSPEVSNTQGASLNRLVEALDSKYPGLDAAWRLYEKGLKGLTWFLADSGLYRYQAMLVDGKRTGGDPDLFRFFVERSVALGAPGRRIGLVVPGTLWQAAGTSGLRALLLKTHRTEELQVYENYRKWAFKIHTSFKFTTFVTQKEPGTVTDALNCAFMLRGTGYLDGKEPHRRVDLTVAQIEALSPGNRSLLDFRSGAEAELAARIYASPNNARFNSPEAGITGVYSRELDMTNDKHFFKFPAWMSQRGFVRVDPVRSSDGSAGQTVDAGQYGSTVKLPATLPAGGEFWVAADADFYHARGYQKIGEFFLHPDDKKNADQYRIVPGGVYTALYEGRMVHQFDHAQKKYVQGEGRRAEWAALGWNEKHLHSRVFVNATEAGQTPKPWRVGFCDVTGATNERTALASLIPPGHLCGNSVPTLTCDDMVEAFLLAALMNSLVFDWLVRFRVSTHLNAHYLYQASIPTRSALALIEFDLKDAVLKLSLTTPEFASWVDGWSYRWSETDAWGRAELRAKIEVLVAEAYGLNTVDFARVLTAFPLLDRDQPALEGDFFVTDATAEDAGAIETPFGWVQERPRSFITRDLTLVTWLRHKGEAIPPDLAVWYRDVVGLDPQGPESRFRIGPYRDLVTRLQMARGLGAVAYVPTGSAEEEEELSEDEEPVE